MAGFDSNFEAIISLISAGTTLSSALAAGNTTGDTALIVSDPDFNANARIQGEDDAALDAGDLILRAGNATAAAGDGGDLLLFAGTSFGGVPGTINITGDTTFNNDVTITGEFTSATRFVGAGTPELSVVANSGAQFTRTDATSLGNNVYVKLTDGVNTGWAPMGPRVVENFIADGIVSIFTVASDGFYRNVAGTPSIDVHVYWNGIRLTEGAALGDFQITAITPGAVQIMDGAGSPLVPLLGDRLIIEYLPL
jgi:hypothetical protein